MALVLLNTFHRPIPRRTMADQTPVLESAPGTTNDSFASLASDDQQEAEPTQLPTREPMMQLRLNAAVLITAAETCAVYFQLVW